MGMTTGGFNSKQLLEEEQILTLPSLTTNQAIEIIERLGWKYQAPFETNNENESLWNNVTSIASCPLFIQRS